MTELQALSMVSTWVNFWRVKIQESPFKTTFPSTLVLVEAPTGAGKNVAYRFMQNNVFKFSFTKMEEELFTQATAQRDAFVLQMEVKYPLTGASESADKKAMASRSRALAEFDAHTAPLGILSADDGSYEGFACDRAYLGRLSFGAPTVRVDEYGDKLALMRRAAYLMSFYNRLLELVDYDELSAKSIKERAGATPGSKGMGISLYFSLAHPDAIQKEELRRAVLKSIGRRGFLVRETNETIELRDINPPDVDELLSFEEEVWKLTERFLEYFSQSPQLSRVITLEPAAEAWYSKVSHQYALELQAYRKSAAPSQTKDVRCALMTDLARKILRVAGLLAVFNRAELQITVADLTEAQAIVTRSFDSGLAFFDDSAHNAANELISFLQTAGPTGRPAMELLALKAFWGLPKRGFQEQVYELLMTEVAPEAYKLGWVLEHFKVKKRDFYKVRPVTADDEFLNNTTPPHAELTRRSSDLVHFYSGRNDTDATRPDGFVRRVDCSDLASFVAGDNVYSAIDFAGGVRRQENFQAANLIILDFDRDVTLEEAQETFKDYRSIIATTKSHGLAKKDAPACDRFRVILFADTTITSADDFRALMAHLTQRFNSDPACKDAARFYYGHTGAIVTVNESGRLFPAAQLIAQLASEASRPKPQPMVAQPPTPGVVARNEVPNFQLIDSRGQTHDAIQFIQNLPVSNDHTTPIRCPWHQDSHASAFASHRSNGGLQVSCSVCNRTHFITQLIN